MPQMAPLNWTIHYMIFSFFLLIMIILIYYSFMYTPKFKKFKIIKKKTFWK